MEQPTEVDLRVLLSGRIYFDVVVYYAGQVGLAVLIALKATGCRALALAGVALEKVDAIPTFFCPPLGMSKHTPGCVANCKPKCTHCCVASCST